MTCARPCGVIFGRCYAFVVGLTDASFVSSVPEGKSKREFTAVIQSLPDVDTPALFGLPPNIEVKVAVAD